MANPGRLTLGVFVCLLATTVLASEEEVPSPRPIPTNIRPRPFPLPRLGAHAPADNRAISRHRDGTITLRDVPAPGAVALPFDSEPAQPGLVVEEPSEATTVETQNFGSLSAVSSPGAWPTSAAVKILMHFPSSGWYVCSGSMIDSLHVLTAGHCVYDTDAGEWADDFLIYPGATDPTNEWTSPTAPFGGAGWTQAHSFTGWTSSGDFDYDIGVIDTDRNVGALSGWYGYGYHDSCSFFQSNTFRTPGYPAESPYDGTRMYTRSGTFDSCDYAGGWYGNEVRFNARSYKGQSGSSQVQSSTNVAFAVLSNGTTSYTDSPRITSSEFTSIQGFISADVPSSVDVMPLWVRGTTSVTAGSALTSLTYAIHNYSSASVSQTYSVSVYLSTNDVISSSDRLLGSHNVSVSLAAKGSLGVNVTSPPVIPADVAGGSYWLGVIINTSDAKTSNNDSSGEDALALTVTASQPVVTIAASDSSAAEPSNAGQFSITRTGSTASSLSVSFSRSGSATNGSDYASLSSPVSIPAGSASVTLNVSPIDDALVEGNETVTLTLSSSSAYTIGSPSAATVTIGDNDSVPACTSFSIAPTSASPGAAASSQVVTLTGSPAGCQSAWSASGNGSWITVSPQNGTGSGSVTVSWAQNNGGARNGSATIAGQSFAVAQSGTSSVRGLYLITPCRLTDTRLAADAPALGAAATRNFAAVGKCGIPSDAIALAANVTAVQPAVIGWMTVFPGPAGATRPPVSTLSYRTGRTRANNALLGVGTDGSINVYNDGAQPLHFIIDITGYFR